jgi:PEP-CTERM motif
MKNRKLSLLVLVLASSFYAPSKNASANILTYFSKATYDAAIAAKGWTSSAPVNFTAESLGVKSNPYTPASSGVSFSLAGGALPEVLSSALASGNQLGNNDAFFGNSLSSADTLTINLPANTHAIGLNILVDETSYTFDPAAFASLQFGTVVQIGETNEADTIASGLPGFPALVGGYREHFVGIIAGANDEISSSAILTAFGGNTAYRIDNIITAVPEPNSLAMLGVACLVGLARRRSTRQK